MMLYAESGGLRPKNFALSVIQVEREITGNSPLVLPTSSSRLPRFATNNSTKKHNLVESLAENHLCEEEPRTKPGTKSWLSSSVGMTGMQINSQVSPVHSIATVEECASFERHARAIYEDEFMPIREIKKLSNASQSTSGFFSSAGSDSAKQNNSSLILSSSSCNNSDEDFDPHHHGKPQEILIETEIEQHSLQRMPENEENQSPVVGTTPKSITPCSDTIMETAIVAPKAEMIESLLQQLETKLRQTRDDNDFINATLGKAQRVLAQVTQNHILQQHKRLNRLEIGVQTSPLPSETSPMPPSKSYYAVVPTAVAAQLPPYKRRQLQQRASVCVVPESSNHHTGHHHYATSSGRNTPFSDSHSQAGSLLMENRMPRRPRSTVCSPSPSASLAAEVVSAPLNILVNSTSDYGLCNATPPQPQMLLSPTNGSLNGLFIKKGKQTHSSHHLQYELTSRMKKSVSQLFKSSSTSSSGNGHHTEVIPMLSSSISNASSTTTINNSAKPNLRSKARHFLNIRS